VFPGTRQKAYYLMSIHEHLPPEVRKQLKELGLAKGLGLAKLARRDRKNFDCAIWLHRARKMPQKQFKQEVEKELTGRETEPWEIIYFKLYQSQMPVIERAIETAALKLGSGRSRGYPVSSTSEQRLTEYFCKKMSHTLESLVFHGRPFLRRERGWQSCHWDGCRAT
jgi:hypothetical protein